MIKALFPRLLLSAPVAAAQTTLTVMTYNIHHGESVAGALDLETIAEIIREQNPDVVGLQEVDRHFSERSAFKDQAAELARLLEMQHCFGANLDDRSATPGKPRQQYGTAILSPHPLMNCQNTPLPQRGEDEQRGLLSVTLELPRYALAVYTTHLQHDSHVARREQAEAIGAALPEKPQRTLLMGDLNATPETAEIRTLTRKLPDTWRGAAGFTYPAEAPETRIDYLLASNDFAVVRRAVPLTQASDHLPVVAVLKLD